MRSEFHGSVFCHPLAWQLFPMGALSPRRRRCSLDLQRDFRVLAAMFFCGLILWLAVQSDPHPAPLFAHFFWQDKRNQIANQRSVCNLERTSNGTDETCRLRRGEGLREAPRAQALRRAIGLAERMQSEASLGVCEDEPPEAQLRCCRINGNSGEYWKSGPMCTRKGWAASVALLRR